MNSKKTLTLLVGIAVVAGLFAFWPQISAFLKGKLPTTGDTGNQGGSSSAGSGTVTPGYASANGVSTAPPSQPLVSNQGAGVNNQTILRSGSRGDSVIVLQALLNGLFAAGLVVDGKFGPLTEAALYKATGKRSISLYQFRTSYAATNQAKNLYAAITGLPVSMLS